VRRPLAAALGALLAATLGGAVGASAEDPSVFPAGEHRDEVFWYCTACHSSRLVSNQAMSRERWDESLTWMTERHGMGELEGEMREAFLDYLTAAFGPDSKGPAATRRPFLSQPQRRNPFAPD
jgi:hypothetical protein